MRDLILGIDLGTTACKVVVADQSASVLASGLAAYPTYSPRPAWSEQDPEEVWQGMVTAIRQAIRGDAVLAGRIGTISFSGAMHGLLPLDAAGVPLTRCLIWADQRSQSQAECLRREHDAHALYLRTGCPLQPLFWPAKLIWLREQRPDIVPAVVSYTSIKDYVVQRLTGRHVMDLSLASATGLLNTHTLSWDEGLLQILGFELRQLPDLVSPETVLGTVTGRCADALGLPPHMAVIAGAGDGGLANLGLGVVQPCQVGTSLGTSGAVRALSSQPRFDARERTWCYVLSPGTWYVGGAINNAGSVYAWLRDQLCPAEVEEASRQGIEFSALLDSYTAEVPPGAEGLVFLPFLLGERNPGWKANARGILFGLSAHHTRKHIVRAAVEGVAFRLFSILQVLEEIFGETQEVRVSGGLAHSPLWVSILADVFGRPVSVPKMRESSALGAVFVALKALGLIRQWSEVRQLVPIERVQEPNPGNHELYSRTYKLFQHLYQDALVRYDELESL